MSDRGLSTARILLRVAIGVVVAVEIVVVLGVGLQALAANPDAGFAEWALRNQDRLMPPFEDLFDDVQIGDSDGVIDLSGLFAMAVYGSLFIPLGMARGWVQRTSHRRDVRRQHDLDAVRQARIYGEPEPVFAQRLSIGQRMRAVVDRIRTTKADDPLDGDRP